MTDLREAAQQALEFVTSEAWGTTPYMDVRVYEDAARLRDALRAALAQQAEPDHETRAELAEQQVVQLAEERDHYRNLWQQAQQAEPVQEPVAHFGSAYVNENGVHITTVLGPVAIPQDAKLYTAPPQRKPLTEEKIDNICRQAHAGADPQEWARNFARAIERAHGIGETK